LAETFFDRLLAEFIACRTAVLCYWFNIVLLGGAIFLSWRCAFRGGLIKADTPEDAGGALYAESSPCRRSLEPARLFVS
jgi:hypothetical protein